MALRLYGDGNIENVTSINTAISNTELGYLDGVTSSIQTQIQTKYDDPATWTEYTPLWGGLSLGNGITSGRYLRISNSVFFMAVFIFGSTSSVTGGVSFEFPTARDASKTTRSTVNVVALDSGSTYYNLFCWDQNIFVHSTTTGAAANITSTSPFTWTTNDRIDISGFYIEA